MRFRFGLTLVFLLLAAAAGVAGFVMPRGEPPPPPLQPSRQHFDLELAKAYVDAGCWQCHAISTLQREMTEAFGAPAAGARPLGPDLAGIGGLYSDGWHIAHLWRPQDAVAHSQMPAQLQLFEAGVLTKPARGGVLPFLQSLDLPGRERASWPRGLHTLPFPGSVTKGQELFVEHCSGCHGLDARGDGPAAWFFSHSGDKPPANIAGAKMVWRTVRAPLPSLDDLYTTITNGLPGSGMPSFARSLTNTQRADLVAYIVELNRLGYEAYAEDFARGPIEFTPDPVTKFLVSHGAKLYADNSKYPCLTCHGPDGNGKGELTDETTRRLGFSPRSLVGERLRRGTLEGIYATIALGLGTGMAGYLQADDSNSFDIWALAAYVRSINKFEWQSQ